MRDEMLDKQEFPQVVVLLQVERYTHGFMRGIE